MEPDLFAGLRLDRMQTLGGKDRDEFLPPLIEDDRRRVAVLPFAGRPGDLAGLLVNGDAVITGVDDQQIPIDERCPGDAARRRS